MGIGFDRLNQIKSMIQFMDQTSVEDIVNDMDLQIEDLCEDENSSDKQKSNIAHRRAIEIRKRK